jgi:hypothetical protein
MSIATFPLYATLLFDGFSEEVEPVIKRTDFESGIPRQAPLKSIAMHSRKVRYHICSAEEYRDFLKWFQCDAKRGASWFKWQDPVDKKFKRARIVDGKLSAEPQESSLNQWVISLEIETWDNFENT